MKKDIILSGVGGQGILSIATVIAEAATASGLQLKQAEVHGMSQRGGDVQSNLRLSTEQIYSDLIPEGKADMIISMEPMEALRYLPWLSGDGIIITSSKSFVNIPDYPDAAALAAELNRHGKVVQADIDAVAAAEGMPKGANMVLLGMAAGHIGIIATDELRKALCAIFSRKGDAIVQGNIKCFDAGLKI